MVTSDELWLLHSGELEMRLGGSGPEPPEPGDVVRLDSHAPQALVPAGVWQSACPAGDVPVLVSCVVSPGFDFADFRMA